MYMRKGNNKFVEQKIQSLFYKIVFRKSVLHACVERTALDRVPYITPRFLVRINRLSNDNGVGGKKTRISKSSVQVNNLKFG